MFPAEGSAAPLNGRSISFLLPSVSDSSRVEQQAVQPAGRAQPHVAADGAGRVLQPAHAPAAPTGRAEVAAVAGAAQ